MRKEERDRIIEALDEDYDSPEEAAEQVWNVVLSVLRDRSSWAVGLQLNGSSSNLVIGPFWDLREAREVESLVSGAGTAFIGQVYPPGKIHQFEGSMHCPQCAHPWFAHWDMGRVQGCVVPECDCQDLPPKWQESQRKQKGKR